LKTMLQKDIEVLVSALVAAHKDGEALVTVEIDNNRCVSPLVYRMIECFDIKPILMTHRRTSLVHRQINLKVPEIESLLMVLQEEVQDEVNRTYQRLTNERRKP